ncbi:MAG: response regulator [Bacillati bacterium ANGP1]|uniref:histidine kinase n=1 Tax=Candidatus Segetimicrobium genomatis TaxID=2569760 RepID=A0A537JWQ7_9BACT|nr:MAG: response regulator [Terrabacteria group bacterium ANGP1]
MRLDFVTDINRDYAASMNYVAIDRYLVSILWWHAGFVALMAFANSVLRMALYAPSPFSWRLLGGGEAAVATLLGIAAAAVPALVRGKIENHYVWRIVASLAFTTYSYLFVFLSGGSIEMHFHFFMVLALLTVYNDWRLGWIVLLLTALHHGILNYVAPSWVYYYGRNDLSVVAHAIPVAATTIFTSLLCSNNRRSVLMLEASRRELERGMADRGAAELRAETANRAKSEFLSRMSHELRTPLNAILGFAQVLEMDSLNPEQRESVGYIVKGGRHLLRLIDEVLDIARIEAGRLAISPEPVPVRDIVREALDLVKPLAAERHVRLLDGGASDAPDQHVLADAQRFKQVLLNFLSNAIKYNREGGTVTLSYSAPAPGRLRLEVIDTGPGIPPDGLERLFAPFERLGAEQAGIEGTGLGLALSKRLVEAMGGRLGAESTLGRGSTFWIELAVAESPVKRLTRDDLAEPASAGGDGSSKAGIVLYVEDNLSNVQLIKRLLVHRPKVRLLPIMQGRLALDLASQHNPDLILLDLQLPDIPGDEVLRRLRETPETRHIPVIVISADATPGQIDRLRAAGAWQYLTKPFDVKKFLSLLDEALKEQEDPQSIPTA